MIEIIAVIRYSKNKKKIVMKENQKQKSKTRNLNANSYKENFNILGNLIRSRIVGTVLFTIMIIIIKTSFALNTQMINKHYAYKHHKVREIRLSIVSNKKKNVTQPFFR